MYFACEASNTTAVCTALADIIIAQPELNWLALVDSAFDYGRAGVSLPNERHAVYDCDGMSDLLPASPILIVLTPHDIGRLRFELTTLIRHRKERPMLSIIGTPASASSVSEHFRLFLNAVTDDGQEFLLRFADTRVLPGLASVLRQAHWDGMTCLLSAWIAIDREGNLQALPLHADRAPLEARFQLSASEFAGLVTNGEPDAVIDVIVESNPEAFPEASRAAIYRTVADSCAFAHQHNVQAFPDLVALAYLALLDEGKALRDPALGEMLRRAEWKVGNLIDDLASFVE